jgi:hypothetical protein
LNGNGLVPDDGTMTIHIETLDGTIISERVQRAWVETGNLVTLEPSGATRYRPLCQLTSWWVEGEPT